MMETSILAEVCFEVIFLADFKTKLARYLRATKTNLNGLGEGLWGGGLALVPLVHLFSGVFDQARVFYLIKLIRLHPYVMPISERKFRYYSRKYFEHSSIVPSLLRMAMLLFVLLVASYFLGLGWLALTQPLNQDMGFTQEFGLDNYGTT